MGNEKKTKMSNAQKCLLWRLKQQTDPDKSVDFKKKERERAKRNRQKPKTPEQLEKLGLVLVQFMHCKGRLSLWYWPIQDEFSWEPVSGLKKVVTLTLNEAASTQRCQYFNVIEGS